MDITDLKYLKPIDVLGLKNFRVFDDKEGFLAELSSINILIGANNSGKSSVVKALQMLRNSIREYKYPFNLDLNQQEHLLGDFNNILFDKTNRNLEITLPFLFMGIKNFCIALKFETSDRIDKYSARLIGVEVIDKSDRKALFSFHYREATAGEKDAHTVQFKKDLQDFHGKQTDESGIEGKYLGLFEPWEDPLEAYVDWRIDVRKLKEYLASLVRVYEDYLKDKNRWRGENLKDLDNLAKDLDIFPSSFIQSFKKEADMFKWHEFVNNKLGADDEIKGMAHVGMGDFQPDDLFFPEVEIEHVLFSKISEILKKQLSWIETDNDQNKYSVIDHLFSNSWEGLLQRIGIINYVSNIKEENARSYNASSSSPFISLLKGYIPESSYGPDFMTKYLNAFEIGKKISVKLDPKYQSILVTITTEDNIERELVDFGYGIKQLVHIILQITVLAQKNKRLEHVYGDDGDAIEETYVPSLLIIEEPESNLHPKWQSILADMFAEANSRYNIQLIIETHSEYLIRKFQTLVANRKVDSKRIKIFYLRALSRVTDTKKQIESLLIEEDGFINSDVFDHGFYDENYNLTIGLLNVRREKFLEDFENLKKSNQETEDKLIEIQQRIDLYTARADVTGYEQIVAQQFDTIKLSPVSIKYLVSGRYLLENIDAGGDYSPVIIQYGRAIENELKQIFMLINPTVKWMLGPMQGSLEKFKGITTNLGSCSNADYAHLGGQLSSMFNNPSNLKIELLPYLRETRNTAGHAGQMMNRQDAENYIQTANEFLDRWIAEKR